MKCSDLGHSVKKIYDTDILKLAILWNVISRELGAYVLAETLLTVKQLKQAHISEEQTIQAANQRVGC